MVKNLLLQNRNGDDLVTKYVALGMWSLPCQGQILLPNAFKWNFFEKLTFLKIVKALVIILTWYV